MSRPQRQKFVFVFIFAVDFVFELVFVFVFVFVFDFVFVFVIVIGRGGLSCGRAHIVLSDVDTCELLGEPYTVTTHSTPPSPSTPPSHPFPPSCPFPLQCNAVKYVANTEGDCNGLPAERNEPIFICICVCISIDICICICIFTCIYICRGLGDPEAPNKIYFFLQI